MLPAGLPSNFVIHKGDPVIEPEDLEVRLIANNRNYPMKIRQISQKGCIAESKTVYREGSLQFVQIHLTYEEVNYLLYGETEWSKDDQWVGIVFKHPNEAVRQKQIELFGRLSQVKASPAPPAAEPQSPPPSEAVASETPRQSSSAVSAPTESSSASQASAPAATPASAATSPAPLPAVAPRPTQYPATPTEGVTGAQEKPASRLSSRFVVLVHQGAPRALCPHNQEWKANLMLIDSGMRIDGSIWDISLRGCSMWMETTFDPASDSRAQLVLQLNQSQRFALPAEPLILEGASILGLRFIDINDDRRRFLNKLILDMRK